MLGIFISSGAIRVVPDKQIILIGSGDCFEGMALLQQTTRIASVILDGFRTFLVLHTKDFLQMLGQDAKLRQRIEKSPGNVLSKIKVAGELMINQADLPANS
jgi:hypothetical protein